MLSTLSRGVGLLSRTITQAVTVNSIVSPVRRLHITPVVCAEPLKKKKRMDPQILRMREQRRQRKLEKSIRILKRHAKKFKPIDEMEVSPALQRELGQRRRPVEAISEGETSFREDLMRVWSNVRAQQCRADAQVIQAMVICQNAALEELRRTSFALYDAAVKPDQDILPFKMSALTETPPIKNYEVPDGKYVDISKKWRP